MPLRKIDSLRAAIIAALPELKRNPDSLRMWIERGSAMSAQTDTEALALTFQLNVLVVEMTSDIAVLGLAVFRWARVNQPDLLAPNVNGFDFDADILDNGAADVLLQLQLDQAVTATPGEGGKVALDYQGEPDPLFDDVLSIIDPQPAPPLTGFTVEDDIPPWEV